LLGHERLNDLGGAAAEYGSLYDFTYNSAISPAAGSFSDAYTHYIVGDGGAVQITAGIGPFLGISVALAAPSVSGSGVFIDPTLVQNSASSAPFTAGIAPGELLTLYGSNLAAATQVAPTADASGNPISLPTTLGNVQVTIGGLPAPIYYVSPSQMSAIVPYGVTGSTAQIQVNNNGTFSNIAWEYVNETSPGVFTHNQNGTGYGAIVHLGIGNSAVPAGTVVSDANPAVEGETLSVFLTGLGAVSPAISDGAPGPSGLSNATGAVSVYFFPSAAAPVAVTPSYAGLAPGYDALYQINITVPASGLAAGPNPLYIEAPDSRMSYLLIPIALPATAATTTATAESADLKAAATRIRLKLSKPVKATPRPPVAKLR
jgi:uncharacterized protein (TIGR03437 family)